MARTRLDFQAELQRVSVSGTHIYYRPPPSMYMEYPAIVYKISDIVNTYANNSVYNQKTAYDVTYITKLADDPMIQILSEFPMSNYNRFYTADNLDHHNFTIYF